MRLWLCVMLAACDSSSPDGPKFHRDGSLQFETGDLAQLSPGDLAQLSPGDLAQSTGGDMATSGNCAAAIASLSFDFESSAGGFTHTAIDGFSGDSSWDFDEWDRGTPSGSGPGACHGGTQCFGTYLPGNYNNCERAMLVTPAMDLSACATGKLSFVFWHWFSFWTDASGPWYDGGLVEFSSDGGTSWVASGGTYPGTIAIETSQPGGYDCLAPTSFYVDGKMGYVQASTGWQQVSIPIPAAMRTSTFQVRFAYSTGVSYPTTSMSTSRNHANPGWYVDDVSIVAQ
jgi:hypothetical protein